MRPRGTVAIEARPRRSLGGTTAVVMIVCATSGIILEYELAHMWLHLDDHAVMYWRRTLVRHAFDQLDDRGELEAERCRPAARRTSVGDARERR
jgi:hypothetical protein